MQLDKDEERLLRSVALQNARAILLARERAERELLQAKESLERKAAELAQQREWLQVTLSSIADAVIATDKLGMVTFLNAEAEKLTGWSSDEAAQQPLEQVFQIVQGDTSRPAVHPVKRVLQDGIVVELANHTDLIARDGTKTCIEDSAAPIKGADGTISGAVMVFRDVTRRRREEEAIRRSEELLTDFFENATEGLHWVGPDGTILRANRAELELLGYTEAEYVGRHIAEFHADSETIRDILEKLTSGQSLVNREATLRCKDGSIKHVLISSNVFRKDGKFIQTRCFTRDITALKKAEQALRESEERFRAMFSQAAVGLAVATLEGRFEQVNKRFSEILLYPMDDLSRRTFADITHPDDLPQTQDRVRRLRAGEIADYALEKRYMRADGSLVWCRTTVSLIKDAVGQPRGFVGVVEDITERKQAEELLRKSEQFNRNLLESSRDWIKTLNLEGDLLWTNEYGLKTLGLRDMRAILGRSWFDFWQEEDRAAAQAAMRTAAETGGGNFVGCFAVNGVRRYWDVVLTPILDATGKPEKLLVVSRDVTEQKQADEFRVRLAAVVESSDDAIISKTLAGFITTWNKGAERLFGYSAEEAIGQHISILIPADRLEEEPGILTRIEAGERIDHYETVRRRKDGTLLDVSLTVSPMKDASGRMIGASKIARDITERKRAEGSLQAAREQLAQHALELERQVAERTAELRETNSQLEDYIYSIAHDLRHPLRAMQGFSEILLEHDSATISASGRDYLQQINRSAQLMDKLLLDLLAYGRTARAPLEIQPVPVQRVWEVAQLQCSPALQQTGARIETVGPLPIVLAHETSLSQILVNLLSNALKFIAPGIPPKVKFFAEEREGTVRLCVEDNGIGIAPEHQERIFRVFERLGGTRFEGTGIGLAIVRKAAERMGGRAGVQSAPRQGSCFWVELPKAPGSRPLN